MRTIRTATREGQNIRQSVISKFGIVLVGFLAVAMYLLWAEHEVHILAFLPLILILGLCLGLHFFMHGNHGGHPDHGSGSGVNSGDGEHQRDDGKTP